jgi:peptide/nickel transport system substrate-binding protein
VWSAMVTDRGGLADPRLRQALSLALDREGIARAAFAGLSAPAKEPVGPGAWGYERDKFQAAYDELPNLPATPAPADLEKAKQLVAGVGPTQPIVIANDGSSVRNVIAAALVSAAQSVGLEATMLQLPNQQYADYYTDPAVRAQADLFIDDYFISKNDPVGFYKNGASDSSVNWVLRDPEYDALVTRARGALDDTERSDIAIDMARRWAEAMPWIPVVQSPTTVVLTAGATGVPASGAYRYYPWAADLGAAGS